MPPPKPFSLGARGEAIAAIFLKKKGFELLEKNFSAPGGEIDLITRKGKIWVFVEVKTRTSEQFGSVRESVGRRKFHRIQNAIEHYFLQKLAFDSIPDFQIDVVLLRISEGKVFCEHLENLGPDDFANQ